MGWSELALDGVEVIQTPGDHLSMIHNPRARILARKLGRVLTQINGR
jgi:thioesterase domain-containing protein